ncbi:unnamed protein product [Schistosoma rodhaini]|uniref:Eukaryotic translation initiation factor 3 subunit G n=1 Tax=Schistosoma mansoni TaxID=6183 RepID=A0A5K4F5N0_SCHMA|nr:unnamed protein product [Schistosoma rodhaini]
MTVSWTDELNEDSELPPIEEKFDPERNIKTVVRYFYNEDGDLIKETKEYQKEKRVVASQVADRKKWRKFGASKSDPSGGNLANTYPADVVTMQIVQSRQPEQEQKKQEEMNVKIKLGEPVIVCNYCKGGHFTRTCPYKSDMEAMQLLQEQLRAKTEPTEETTKDLQNDRSGRYIPPSLRGDAANTTGSSMSTDKRPFDENTVRVTNLPPDTTADELKSVFSAFGHVMRIYPAKDKLTQQNRGFAFISFRTAEEAKSAIYGVNGLRHNHVVLKVDWARPSNN